MQKAFKDLLESLTGLRDGVLPSTQAFPPLDTAQIERDLDIERRANESPVGAADDGFDVVEMDILKEIENRARKGNEEYRTRLALYESRIRDATATAELRVEIDAAGRAAISDFELLATNHRNHLLALRREVDGREAEYQQFRVTHHLDRLPRAVGSQLAMKLTLVFFFFMETILNGMFFAQGSEAGIIGGIMQAAVLSVLNVLPAVAFAMFGIPFLVHRRFVIKTVGVLLLLAYLAWLLALNVLIAHFRDLFIAGSGHVELNVLWQEVVSRPFGLKDAQSWLLACLGILVGLTSVYSASKLDDPYWGYGEIGRNRESTVHRFADRKEECLFELGERRNDAVAAMTDVMHELRRYEYERRLATEGRLNLHADFCSYLEHLGTSYCELVAKYRGRLSRVRAAAGEDPRQFGPMRGPNFLVHPTLSALPEIDGDIRRLAIEKLEYYIKTVNDGFSAHVQDYDVPAHALNRKAEVGNASS